VTPAAWRSMSTRAPCGDESIRNEPTNDPFFVFGVERVFSTTAEPGCPLTTGIARSATSGISDTTGDTGGAAGAWETGSDVRTNCSGRGCSGVVSHETRITHTSAPKAEPDANDQSLRRSFTLCPGGTGSTRARFARRDSGRRTAGRRLARLLGVGRGVAGLIDAGRSEENSSSGSGAHRPLRSWLTDGFDGSIGWSDTQLSKSQSPFRVLRADNRRLSYSYGGAQRIEVAAGELFPTPRGVFAVPD
jgi:hypothetical protein